jgi:hypothetical protein
MRKISILLLPTILFATQPQISFNQEEFLSRVKTIYHSLSLSGLDNFSCWITSDIFLEKTKDFYNEEEFPFEIIWKNPNKLFYINRAIPSLTDVEDQKRVEETKKDLLQELKGLFIDWQRFCAGNVLDDLPETHLIYSNQDTAFIRYQKYDSGKNLKVKMFFGVNGLLMKIVTMYPDTREEIFIYPGYRLVENKWLCNKWTVQMLKNGQVDGGFVVKLELKKSDNFWIPVRIIMQLQKKEYDKKLFIRDYKLRNIMLNREIKILQ